MKITTKSGKEHVVVEFKHKTATHLAVVDGVRSLIVEVPYKESGNRRQLRLAVRHAVRLARAHRILKISLDLSALIPEPLTTEATRAEIVEDIVTNLFLAEYEFSRYKTNKDKVKRLSEIALLNTTKVDASAIKRGQIIGEHMNAVRDLANTPGGDMTPQTLASSIQRLARGSKAKVKVLGVKEIEKLKMGALLGVARGSTAKPRFIIIEYWGAEKGAASSQKPVVLVGKGITFDTGGLNIKPSEAVLDMHLDMSGGAAVAGAVIAAARLGIKRNVIALVPAAENMVSGESFRPGDVLTSMSGKTIDVLNTDAEGRLVLADGLTYAKRYDPKLVIDVATLTGAALVAVGLHASAIMSKDETLIETMRTLGEKTGDYVWPLPMWDEYKQYTKGVHGDIANIPSSHARYGGSINGAMFLSHFTEGMRWAHIDMAPRMTSAPGDHLAKGATGEPMRLLLALAEAV